MNRFYCLLVVMLAGCGGGSSSSTADTVAATAAISAHMSTEYAIDQTALDASVNALARQEAALGLLCSGNELIAAAGLKVATMPPFVSASIAFVQSTKNSGLALDKPAIINLFDSYQTQDLAWPSAASTLQALGNCGWSAGQIAAIQPQLSAGVSSATATWRLRSTRCDR